MSNKLLRSPQYISASSSNASVKSAKLLIKINSTLRYTLVKDASQNVNVAFEYSELCRDYLDIELGSSSSQPTIDAFAIRLEFSFWDNVNPSAAGATQLGSTTTQDHYGYDGYGTFMQGEDPILNSSTAFPAISNFDWDGSSSSGSKTYTVYAPPDSAVRIPSIDTTNDAGKVVYTNSSINATSVSVEGITINIVRVPCTKYTDELSSYWSYVDVTGLRVYFINKYGAIQNEFFTLKMVQQIQSKRDQYNTSTIDSTGDYDTWKHTKRDFDISGQQSITLNSFYVPEYYNKVFTEMLLSEKIWVRMRAPYTGDFMNFPVNIKDSGFTYKNQLNDKLIQFTFNFDMSFDYINNNR